MECRGVCFTDKRRLKSYHPSARAELRPGCAASVCAWCILPGFRRETWQRRLKCAIYMNLWVNSARGIFFLLLHSFMTWILVSPTCVPGTLQSLWGMSRSLVFGWGSRGQANQNMQGKLLCRESKQDNGYRTLGFVRDCFWGGWYRSDSVKEDHGSQWNRTSAEEDMGAWVCTF